MLCDKFSVILARKDIFGEIKALIFPLLLANKMYTHQRNFPKK